MRYGMLIDLSRCTGCDACTVACKSEHGTSSSILLSQVLKSESGTYPQVKPVYQPILCNHCENPPCVDVCPTGASEKHANGIVTVDTNKCIGCRYCMLACPYDARKFHYTKAEGYYPEKGYSQVEQVRYADYDVGVVEKCDFCIERVNQGELPICVKTCPSRARFFGDLDDPDSEVSQLIVKHGAVPLHAELGTGPSVYYVLG